jgi:hypothetical protein
MKKLILLFIVAATAGFAQTSYTWNGSTSTNWNTSTNWAPNGIPGSTDNVNIVPGANNCILAANTSVSNLTITNGVLNLNGFTLNTSGVVACNSGTCTGGTFNSTATSLTFAGTVFNSNITANVTEVYFNGSTFNGNVTVTKNGGTNAQSSGNNTFNGTTSITNAGTGYLMLTNGGAGRTDVFNGPTTLNTTNTANLYIGYGRNADLNANVTVNNTAGTGSIFLGNTGSINLGTGKTITFSTSTGGALNINRLTQAGSTALNLSPGSTGAVNIYNSNITGSLTVNAGIISAQTSTFAAAVTYSASGTILNNWSSGGNIYNGVLTVHNSSNGFIGFANGTADTYNADVYANNTSTTGGRIIFGNNCTSQFNGNVYVSQTGVTSASGIAIGWGGTFPLINFGPGKKVIVNGTYNSGYLQLFKIQQSDATAFNLTTTGTSEVMLQNNTFLGNVTVSAPDIRPYGGTYNSPVSFTKTGGGTGNHNNGNLNIFNSTVYLENQSNGGYILLGYNSADQFNDDVTVSCTGTGGISLGWSGGTGTPTLAAGKTVLIGPGGFNNGFLQFGGFTQLGNAPINLPLMGTAAFYVVNTPSTSVFGGALTVTAADVYIRGGIFNGPTAFTKTGGVDNHNSGNQNTFNSTLDINQQSTSGYFMLGYNSNDLFNGDITVSNTGTRAINLGYTSGSGTPTLASGKTIKVGPAGFSGGSLLLSSFTQLGNAPITLTLTGATTLATFGPSVNIGGNVTLVSPRILLNGGVYNGTTNFTKTGSTGEWSNGGNTFQGTATINSTASAYFGFANGAPDIYNGDVFINNNGTDRILFGNSSTGNQFNGNITLTQTGSAVGTAFGWNSSTDITQAAGKGITIGGAGYSSGYLYLMRFTQLGSAPLILNLAPTADVLKFGPSSSINGDVTSTSPGLIFDGCNFGGTVTSVKTGTTNDNSAGGNTFNGITSITNDGTGHILLGNTSADAFNASTTFNNTGGYRFYFAYNHGGQTTTFASDLTLNSNKSAGTDGWSFYAGEGTNTSFSVAGNFVLNILGTLQSNSRFLNGSGSSMAYNGNVTINSTNSHSATTVYMGSVGTTTYNGNITVSNTAGGTNSGIIFNNGAAASSTLAATKTISLGAGGFVDGTLSLLRFTQLGSTAQSLPQLTGLATLVVGPSSRFDGNVTFSFPQVYLNGAIYNGTSNIEKNGAGNNSSQGGNIFNAASIITNSGNNYFLLGNTNPDVWNSDVTFTNSGAERLLPAWASTGNLFNGNIFVNTTGSGLGIQFCGGNTTATATLAATKTIAAGAFGLNAGYLILKQFTQLGNAAVNLTLTPTANYLQFGPSSTIGGNVTSLSPRILFNGCTFNGTTNCTKNGAIDDDSNGSNTFVGVSTITNYGSGRILLGNANTDAFMSNANFNNLGTNNMYIAHNSANNTFGGVVTFSNAPTGNYGIYVSGYSAGTVFSDNIIVSNVNGSGVQFCYANTTASSTLSPGKTISIGPAGFNTGTLLLKQFTQLGSTAQTLSITTGNALLQLGPSSVFNGNVDFSFPQVLLHGTTYNNTANITKNGASDNAGNGGNIFNGATNITNSGSGYLLTGNSNADQFNGITTINNTGSYRIYFAHNHIGQTTTFTQPLTLNAAKTGGSDNWSYLIGEGSNVNVSFNDVTINIAGNLQSNLRILQGSGTAAIYNGNLTVNLTNTNASGTQVQLGTVGTSQYNGNITLNSTTGVTGSGVYFNTNAAASSTLASGKSIGLGGSGFTSGNLSMVRFTQLGTTTQSILQTSGTAVLTSGPGSTFNGPVSFNFPQIYLQGTVYNNTASIEKNGATDNACSGGNTFNGVTTITNSHASNYLRLANSTADAYNADVTMVQTGTGVLAPNYNTNCSYSGNITVTSPAATAITFGPNTNGVATLTGGTAQSISRTAASAFPVFTRLVVAKTAGDVTLNTKIFVSSALTLTQGLVNTTAANILHMTNASTTNIGSAASFINGPMNYDMALNGARTLTFPIGKVADWRPAVLALTHNNSTSYTYNSEVFNADAHLLGWTYPATVDMASHVHWWDISRSNTSTGVVTPTLHLNGNQTVTLYYDTNDGVTDPSKLTVIKNTYTASTAWIDIGGTGAVVGTGNVTSTSSPSSFNSFSRFTLGNRIGGTNPLPIELLYFTASPVENTVELDWATASELNNSHYEIERSADGISYEYLETIAAYGNGTSNSRQTYHTTDKAPYKGISYYRLKQVDKTGEFKYADVVSVEFSDKSYINLYPNPTSGILYIKTSDDYKNASVKITNIIGVEVISGGQVKTHNGVLDLSGLPSGIYHVVIENGGKTETVKISVQQ